MLPVLLRTCPRLPLNARYNRVEQPNLRRHIACNASILRFLSTKAPHTLQQHNPSLPSEDTIFALSSAPGRAAIAVIRISGPACVEIYKTLCPSKPLPRPRSAAIRTLFAPATWDAILYSNTCKRAEYKFKPDEREVLDSETLLLYFPAPKTVTGEDILELHVHGGTAIVKAVLAAIPKCMPPLSSSSSDLERSTIRYAEAGEFTRRAFLNNRLSLTQVEALGDVLAANTEQQRQLSVRGAAGTLSKQYETWRKDLLYARGELEALIDFSEDQYFDESPAYLAQSVAKQVKSLVDKLEPCVSNAVRGELLRNGISIALLGAPNVGKSSLLNRIVGREATIVSREAGTTRDVVEAGIDLGGYLCRLGDMAGLRSDREDGGNHGLIGVVEEEGIKRAKVRALESDVVICVFHIERTPNEEARVVKDEEVMETARQCLEREIQVVVVINKLDLLDPQIHDLSFIRSCFQDTILDNQNIYFISCKNDFHNDNGIGVLLKGLTKTFARITSALSLGGDEEDISMWQESLGASERHRLLLQECLSHLQRFLVEVAASDANKHHIEAASRAEDQYLLADYHNEDEDENGDIDVVLAAESLRAAADCLARITGRGIAGDVEEVLGVVFERFCVGK